MNGRALVTGSSGFVGRHMVQRLLTLGWDVNGVDIQPGRYGWQSNMLDYLRHETSPYSLVVHAAARSPHRLAIDTDHSMHAYNTQLDAALFEWAIRTQQGRVLYLSSCAAMDEEPDMYGRTKLHGEALASSARAAGVPVTVVRPYSGYGEDQSENHPFRAFVERACRHEDPFTIWGDGNQVRDWVHIDDVVDGALVACQNGTEEPVQIGTGVGTSMNRLASLICMRAGYSPEFQHTGTSGGAASRVMSSGSVYQAKIDIEEGIRRAFR